MCIHENEFYMQKYLRKFIKIVFTFIQITTKYLGLIYVLKIIEIHLSLYTAKLTRKQGLYPI